MVLVEKRCLVFMLVGLPDRVLAVAGQVVGRSAVSGLGAKKELPVSRLGMWAP
jgi:hypothetical protein